jgi:heme oxygenase (biliverdin-IX-beta and delta-forming)
MEKAILDPGPHAVLTEGGELHRSLRTASQRDHELIDRVMSNIEMGDAQGYGAFLSIHCQSLHLLEPHWREEDRADLAGMAECLGRDLLELGVPSAAARAAAPARLPPACGLGIAYVIRGSRLGSAILRRKVPAHFAQSYLDFVPLLSWNGFLRQLDRFATDSTSIDRADVLRGASLAFAIFQRQADRCSVQPS